jgi:hypothetical protein
MEHRTTRILDGLPVSPYPAGYMEQVIPPIITSIPHLWRGDQTAPQPCCLACRSCLMNRTPPPVSPVRAECVCRARPPGPLCLESSHSRVWAPSPFNSFPVQGSICPALSSCSPGLSSTNLNSAWSHWWALFLL